MNMFDKNSTLALLWRYIFKDRIETNGFTNAYEACFSQLSSIAVPEFGVLSQSYEVDAAFFVNSEETIAYMAENVRDRRILSFGAERDELKIQQLRQQLEEKDAKRFFAYSVCDDGTQIVTGNFGFNLHESNRDVPVGDMLLQNIKQRSVHEVLRHHKYAMRDREIACDPQLVEKFVATYETINTYSVRLSL